MPRSLLPLVSLLWLALAALLVPPPAQAQEGLSPRKIRLAMRAAQIDDGNTRTLTVNGEARRYRLFRPASAAPGARLPLVLALHGGGGNARQFQNSSGFDAVAGREGFLVIYPQGTGQVPTWNAGDCCARAQRENVDDVGFLRALIAHAVEHLDADPARVYMTGMSNGAMMSHRFAVEAPELLAAIAPVAGTLSAGLHPRAPMPMMQIHGSEDPLVPWAGGPGRMPGIGPRNSVTATIEAWRNANSAATVAIDSPLPDAADDGMRTIEHRYPAQGDARRVVLYEIVGGGHSWPRGGSGHGRAGQTLDFDAAEAIWAFFRGRRR